MRLKLDEVSETRVFRTIKELCIVLNNNLRHLMFSSILGGGGICSLEIYTIGNFHHDIHSFLSLTLLFIFGSAGGVHTPGTPGIYFNRMTIRQDDEHLIIQCNPNRYSKCNA